MRAVLFENSRLLDPTQDHVLEGLSVLVEGDTIREVSARPPRLAGATVVDCDGRTLMPGLIDCHVHVFLSEVNIRALEAVPLTLMTARGTRQDPVRVADLDWCPVCRRALCWPICCRTRSPSTKGTSAPT